MSKTYYQLQNDQLALTIHSLGAELTSLKDSLTQTEYIWQADPTFWKRHSPVLFPIVGSLKNKAYTYADQTYPMGQHGFARDTLFTLKSQTEDELWMTLHATPDTLKLYPFNFCLEVGYKLTHRTVTVLWKVINQDTKTMYFSIGAHPAFNCQPDNSNSSLPQYLIFDNQKDLTYQLLNDEGLLLPEMHTLKLTEGCHQIEANLFDNDALIIEHNQAHKVSLADKNKKPYITVDFDAPLFGLWSPAKKAAPFVCIEPWYGRCDAADFTGCLEERAYGHTLTPGETFSASYKITAHAL